MSHKVTFTYMDGKELIVYHKDDEIAQFMESVGKSEVYFNDVLGRGMWIPIDRIRYFQVEREDDIGTTAEQLPKRNAPPSIKEKTDREGGGDSVDESLHSPESNG